MDFRVLAVGDVVGESGMRHVERHLRQIQRQEAIDFTVINGENTAGVGIMPEDARRLYQAGADVITLGNHTMGRPQIAHVLEEADYILRPANFTNRAPGRGWAVYDMGRFQVKVINLIGRCDLHWGGDNPFIVVDDILKQDKATFTLVDFHAQASSEKLAMGYHVDGRVSALWGTHTHVPTADERVYPKGTGYISDLGMTGPIESVLGVKPEMSVESFLGGYPGRFVSPEGPCKMQGAVFTLNSDTGLCTGVKRIDIR